MTHSGGKPHNVGDKGQRYEVSFFDPRLNERRAFGWSDEPFAAHLMADSIERHPAWQFPQIKDRTIPEPIHNVEGKRIDGYGDPAKGEYNAFLGDDGSDIPCD